jgi:murein DD-endopeptidase MepM/ murein hydrolase activator NlpD
MRRLLAACWSLLLAGAALGQAAYKYRDAAGHWVFTDEPPPAGVASDTIKRPPQELKLSILVTRVEDADATRLLAVNDCLCTVTIAITILQSDLAGLGAGAILRDTLEPRTQKTLARIPGSDNRKAAVIFKWSAALGSPYATHKPLLPYRAPFDIGSTYLVSQAYPSQITHAAADSRFAIDFALPDGTPVYAAREGVVINARHDFFHGAVDPVMMDQANIVEILHDDGSIALYAHLHWDSIRVRIGQKVTRGEYIANSGNTGFTSGPHLHFAVVVNSGTEDVSVPVEFAGAAGVSTAALDRKPLTAY